jgi:hypothetical protein
VRRAESREQRAESREQRAESREQRAESREQRAERKAHHDHGNLSARPRVISRRHDVARRAIALVQQHQFSRALAEAWRGPGAPKCSLFLFINTTTKVERGVRRGQPQREM